MIVGEDLHRISEGTASATGDVAALDAWMIEIGVDRYGLLAVARERAAITLDRMQTATIAGAQAGEDQEDILARVQRQAISLYCAGFELGYHVAAGRDRES